MKVLADRRAHINRKNPPDGPACHFYRKKPGSPLYEYLDANAREVTVRHFSKTEVDEKRFLNSEIIREFRRQGEKVNPELKFPNYEVHHIVPLYLGGKDVFRNYAFVHTEFHRYIHRVYIDSQVEKKQKMRIPFLKGKIWDPPFDVPERPARRIFPPPYASSPAARVVA